MSNQKGFAPVVFILAVILLSGGIIGGSYYIKNNNPSLIKVINRDSLQTASNSSTVSEDPVQNDKASKAFDPIIKSDFEVISKVLSCHILKNPTYPGSESEVDKSCMFAGGKFPYNPNTNKPYFYRVTSEGKGYLLKAKLYTGEIYTITEKKNSPNIASLKQKELEGFIAQGDKVTEIKIIGDSTDKITFLPASIKNLNNLQILILSSNAICELPPEIGELNLKWFLYLDANCLKSLPEEVWNLTNLIGLNLGYNKLQVLPSGIGKLVALQDLWINNNELTTLPKEIGDLKIIQSIDASNNKLTLIPPEVGNLTNIRGINLSNNKLTTLPDEISKLDNRQADKRYSFSRLQLEGNQFSEQEKQRIKQLLPTIEITF